MLSGRLFKKLNRLCPARCWAIKPIKMWEVYRCELVPNTKGIYSAISRDGRKVPFDEFFRIDRELQIEKGIIQIVKE